MPIPSGCCSRLAFRCVRFPAAALGLRFYRRAGFPVPSGQSFVRALRCASVSRQRPSACGFPPCRVSRSVRTVVRSGFPLCVRFPAASLGLRFFRRAGFPVPWGSRTYRTLCRPLSLPLLSLPLLSLCCPSLSSSLFAAPLSAPSPALPLRPALGRHYLKSRYSFVYLISEKG